MLVTHGFGLLSVAACGTSPSTPARLSPGHGSGSGCPPRLPAWASGTEGPPRAAPALPEPLLEDVALLLYAESGQRALTLG